MRMAGREPDLVGVAVSQDIKRINQAIGAVGILEVPPPRPPPLSATPQPPLT